MVDKMVATPALQLADVFPPFAWTFGKVRRRRASRRNPRRDVRGRAAAAPLAAFRAFRAQSRVRTVSFRTRASASVPVPSRATFSDATISSSARALTNTHLPSASMPLLPLRTLNQTRRAT